MSGLYSVVFKWAPATYHDNEILSRNVLCFSSRYDADEFYRQLQTLKYNNAQFMTRLSRSSPQFWTYDSNHNGDAVYFLFKWQLMSNFKNVVTLLNNSSYQAYMYSLPNLVTGPDWLSGDTFFIRNRRQPNLYWWVHDTHIHTSEQRRTKFRIQKTPGHDDTTIAGSCKPVLIRKDHVHVGVVTETVTSSAVTGGAQFVSIRDTKNKSNSLTLDNKPYLWIFGELLQQKVGVRWGDEIPEEKGQMKPLLVFMPNDGGDEWELC
ncbi:hypothetical protein ASPCAL00267 [Aspergillus calidoustus]|uniref:Uncharacterized protein n=1 Tax=Aspergillus calidoustus TaxID=454130 RepID=A0A0U5FPY8_ASPCI|nr:hypothetical protein ASPCAL00267 [Aspergillus calidoustus]